MNFADREINLLFFTNGKSKSLNITLQYTNANLPGLAPVGPPMWQAEADTVSLSTGENLVCSTDYDLLQIMLVCSTLV